MTPEQITAAAKSRDATVFCVHAEGLWGSATSTMMSVDKSVIDVGGVSADDKCNIQFINRREK